MLVADLSESTKKIIYKDKLLNNKSNDYKFLNDKVLMIYNDSLTLDIIDVETEDKFEMSVYDIKKCDIRYNGISNSKVFMLNTLFIASAYKREELDIFCIRLIDIKKEFNNLIFASIDSLCIELEFFDFIRFCLNRRKIKGMERYYIINNALFYNGKFLCIINKDSNIIWLSDRGNCIRVLDMKSSTLRLYKGTTLIYKGDRIQ